MKVEQAPILKELQNDPRALEKLFSYLLKRAPQNVEDILILQDKAYTIQGSPAITKEADS